jgi:hypothetical protein
VDVAKALNLTVTNLQIKLRRRGLLKLRSAFVKGGEFLFPGVPDNSSAPDYDGTRGHYHYHYSYTNENGLKIAVYCENSTYGDDVERRVSAGYSYHLTSLSGSNQHETEKSTLLEYQGLEGLERTFYFSNYSDPHLVKSG